MDRALCVMVSVSLQANFIIHKIFLDTETEQREMNNDYNNSKKTCHCWVISMFVNFHNGLAKKILSFLFDSWRNGKHREFTYLFEDYKSRKHWSHFSGWSEIRWTRPGRALQWQGDCCPQMQCLHIWWCWIKACKFSQMPYYLGSMLSVPFCIPGLP